MKINILPSIRKIHDFLKKHYPLILGIVFGFLLCLNLLISYIYIYRVITVQAEPIIDKTCIDQETLQKVLDNLDKRQENLSRVQTDWYKDPFR